SSPDPRSAARVHRGAASAPRGLGALDPAPPAARVSRHPAVRLPRPARYVIFDLDGVLLDTERFYTEVTQAIVGRWGKTFDWSVKGNMIGRPARDSARYLVETLQLPITADEYLRERAAML